MFGTVFSKLAATVAKRYAEAEAHYCEALHHDQQSIADYYYGLMQDEEIKYNSLRERDPEIPELK